MRKFSKPVLIALFLLAILIFASTSTALAAPLHALVRTTLDGSGGLDVGNVPSLTLDGYSRPVIAYTDVSGTALKVAYCDDPTCSGFTLNKVDDADSGYYASIKLDANGLPVISYQREFNLYIAFCSTPACDPGTVTIKGLDTSGRVSGYTSMQLDSAGRPIVSYSRSSGGGTGGLWVAHCNDTQCDSVTLTHTDSTAGTSYTSMQLNSSGNPVIAYAAVPNVRFLTCTAPDCSTVTGRRTFDGGSLYGQYISLELNASGLARAIYYNNGVGVRYLECTNASCSTRNITTLTGTTFTSLALNSSGVPVFTTSTTNSPYQLRLFRCGDAACSSTTSSTLDTVRTFNSSLVLDCDDNPVVAYYNFADQDLKVAMDDASSCGSSPAPGFGSTPAASGPLEFVAVAGASAQLSINVYNQVHATDLDVSLSSISSGYSIVSGLPIDDQDSGAATITVQCDSAPQAAGTLVLATNDAANPTITYNLTCVELVAQFNGAPAAAAPLAFTGAAGTAPQLTIDVTNTGTGTSQLDVSLASISAGYTVLSGLPVNSLLRTDPATAITVQCDSVPQSPGTLVLNTTDASQPTVTYTLTCQLPSIGGSGSSSSSSASSATGEAGSTSIAPSGVTTLRLGSLLVSLPAQAIPPGQTGCQLSGAQLGGSAAYGFALDDAVFDVKVHCDSGELNIFLAPLTICIQPADGVTNNKLVYHSHNGGSFQPMNSEVTQPGYVCGQTRLLSVFTLGQLALPNTGFAPGAVSALADQPAEAAYAATDLSLSIPKLGVELNILGVPQGPNGWDVSWLGQQQAGYLYGTSFPTLAGNTALTAHVWNADNTAGPFFGLKELRYGDRFTISAFGQTYTYEVRSNQIVQPNNLAALAKSNHNLITLITCESFSEASGDYLYRRAVQAVLISVE